MSLFSAPANRRDIGRGANTTAGDVSVTSRFRGFFAGRWRDYRRELRIRDLRLRMNAAFSIGDIHSVRYVGRQIFDECEARSERQWKRMERRALSAMDEHMREALGK